MTAEFSPEARVEIAHVLAMDVVGYSKLLINEQSWLIGELTIVRGDRGFQRRGGERQTASSAHGRWHGAGLSMT